MENIKRILPARLGKEITLPENDMKSVSGIRIKAGCPMIFSGEREIIPNPGNIITEKDTEDIISLATENSLYAYLDEIKNGFITIRGGHRLGLGGVCIYGNNEIKTIKKISFINIRIAREIKGAADGIMKKIYDGQIRNTLIISPPGGGKTTLLRDVARNLGNIRGMKPVVIDSRCEIGAQHEGVPQTDIGERTFLLSGYSKKDGFNHAIRALSPDVILCDEIGGAEDAKIISYASRCGVGVIATVHGSSRSEAEKKGIDIGAFEFIVILKKRKIVNYELY